MKANLQKTITKSYNLDPTETEALEITIRVLRELDIAGFESVGFAGEYYTTDDIYGVLLKILESANRVILKDITSNEAAPTFTIENNDE